MSDDRARSGVASGGSAGVEGASGHEARLLMRLANRVAELLHLPEVDLSFDKVVARSERRTGLSDWGSDDFFDRLRFSLDCAHNDDALSPIGRLGASVVFNWHAANRLRIVDYVKQRPEIPEIPIEKPIFIVGWYRTGTTNLHNLLNLDPGARAPLCYELCYPLPQHPNPEKDRRLRVRRTAQKWRLADFVGPDQKYAHELRADGPEECFFMLANSALFVQQIMGFLGYDYARTLLAKDVLGAYRDLRLQYQILASQGPVGRWIMKCPLHMWFLDDLIEVFPDAQIIHTHRAAAEAIPSVCSLSAIMAQPLAANFDPFRHGAFFRDFCRQGIDRAMASRARIPADQILDITLGQLSADPVGTVRTVCERFDLRWDDEMPARIERHLAAEARHEKQLGRKHRYSAEQFGLTAEGLEKEFEDYEVRFLSK